MGKRGKHAKKRSSRTAAAGVACGGKYQEGDLWHVTLLARIAFQLVSIWSAFCLVFFCFSVTLSLPPLPGFFFRISAALHLIFFMILRFSSGATPSMAQSSFPSFQLAFPTCISCDRLDFLFFPFPTTRPIYSVPLSRLPFLFIFFSLSLSRTHAYIDCHTCALLLVRPFSLSLAVYASFSLPSTCSFNSSPLASQLSPSCVSC